MTPRSVQQRSDLTFKHNVDRGRHGWLRLTPAYSVKMVDEILKGLETGAKIVDPFSGTGTTVLSAAYRNFQSMAVEINPFLVWLMQAKSMYYSCTSLERVQAFVSDGIREVDNDVSYSNIPSIHNVSKWWDHETLSFLCYLKATIDNAFPAESPERNLLLLAFCRTLIELSNAAFNHQSLSFRKATPETQQSYHTGLNTHSPIRVFRRNVSHILEGAACNPPGTPEIILGDARNVDSLQTTCDMLITSPPYANRMSYIRELRPYMYWLGYINEARDAGELDWHTIGGTWGIATSRLHEWTNPETSYSPPYLNNILQEIARTKNKNGRLLSRYIEKYFVDIWEHLCSIQKKLATYGNVHYIIGNSTFYGTLLPTEKIYADMLGELGLENVSITLLRKRNSKKALFEYDVSATKR